MVLTAAHVIADATFLQVQLAGQPDKVTARVLAVAHETDLALVEVPAQIFEGVAPLTVAPLDALPALRDKVYVLGFPTGGDDLSITEGVVSRVEVQSYSHSHARALAITVDAAVNSGNSGGPVISEDSGLIVGIAFQGYAGAPHSSSSNFFFHPAFAFPHPLFSPGSDIENQGHMVPAPLIQRFLAAAASGRSPGLPSLGAYLQTLQARCVARAAGNDSHSLYSILFPQSYSLYSILIPADARPCQSPALRSRLRMGPSHSGMLVTSVEHGACCEGLLRPGDVLLELDGKRLSNDGTCVLLGRRLALAAVLHRRFFGDSIVLRLLRDGSEEVVTATLAPSAGLVPKGVYDAAPPYFLLAGLLFQTLSLEYLHTWGELEKAPPHLLALYYDGVVTPMRTEVVILTQARAHACSAPPFRASLRVITSHSRSPLPPLPPPGAGRRNQRGVLGRQPRHGCGHRDQRVARAVAARARGRNRRRPFVGL